jgi:hypothetical protein
MHSIISCGKLKCFFSALSFGAVSAVGFSRAQQPVHVLREFVTRNLFVLSPPLCQIVTIKQISEMP